MELGTPVGWGVAVGLGVSVGVAVGGTSVCVIEGAIVGGRVDARVGVASIVGGCVSCVGVMAAFSPQDTSIQPAITRRPTAIDFLPNPGCKSREFLIQEIIGVLDQSSNILDLKGFENLSGLNKHGTISFLILLLN
jgi:hypothetical protein